MTIWSVPGSRGLRAPPPRAGLVTTCLPATLVPGTPFLALMGGSGEGFLHPEVAPRSHSAGRWRQDPMLTTDRANPKPTLAEPGPRGLRVEGRRREAGAAGSAGCGGSVRSPR